jgi:hypothetical protein
VSFSLSSRDIVKNTLEANGFGWIPSHALDPVERWEDRSVLRSRTAIGFETDPFVAALASYEFRKLLRHLIGLRGASIGNLDALAARLGQSAAAIQRALAVLTKRASYVCSWPATSGGHGPGFTPDVDSRGPTLEWYVAFLFNHDLHWHATTNVVLEAKPRDALGCECIQVSDASPRYSDGAMPCT